jgi:hypothetical protein
MQGTVNEPLTEILSTVVTVDACALATTLIGAVSNASIIIGSKDKTIF